MRRKSKQQPKPVYDYTHYEADFGFLTLIMNREVSYAIQYEIAMLAAKLVDSKANLKDIDIDPICSEVTSKISDCLSDNYKNFLTDKYFKDEHALMIFIAETVRHEITQATLKLNIDKVTKLYNESLTESILSLNQKIKKGEEK